MSCSKFVYDPKALMNTIWCGVHTGVHLLITCNCGDIFKLLVHATDPSFPPDGHAKFKLTTCSAWPVAMQVHELLVMWRWF